MCKSGREASQVFGRPTRMSGCVQEAIMGGREAFPDVREWSEALPDVREWSGDPHG